jgi:hypothetical protein
VSQKKKALELEESSVPGQEQDGMQPAAFPFLSRHTTKYASIGSAQSPCNVFPFFFYFLFVLLQVLRARDSLQTS